MKKILGFILAVALLTAVFIPVQAQTFGVNPYNRIVALPFQIDTSRTSNDSSFIIYAPCRMEILEITAIAKTVTDTVDVVLGKTNPVTLVNSTSTATARLLTANIIAYGKPTTRTTMEAGTYWKVIMKINNGDASNVAYKVRGIIWCLLN
jgi:hypothetical protein